MGNIDRWVVDLMLGFTERDGTPKEKPCTCGIPSKANVYVCVTIGKPGETTYVEDYFCTDHEPEPEELVPDGWEALESESTQLR